MNANPRKFTRIIDLLAKYGETKTAAASQVVEAQESAAEATTQSKSMQRVKHTTPRQRKQNGGAR